jgi:hypothetical protein
MTKHPFVPTTAQSGGRRIGVSVKTLASLFARKSLAKAVAKLRFRARDGRIQSGTSLHGRIKFTFCYSYIYSGLRIHNAEPAMEEEAQLCLIIQNKKREKVRNRLKKSRFRQSESKRLAR